MRGGMHDPQLLPRNERQFLQRHAQQRKADMHRLADAFEGAVGEIVETVSSSANELEMSANTLTTAATRSQQLATMVAAASEEASTNVQSVASASEELTSSVGEISRQVQQSSRVANDAVSQAQKTDARITELSGALSTFRPLSLNVSFLRSTFFTISVSLVCVGAATPMKVPRSAT